MNNSNFPGEGNRSALKKAEFPRENHIAWRKAHCLKKAALPEVNAHPLASSRTMLLKDKIL